MLDSAHTLTVGHPVFPDQRLQDLAQREGIPTAWREAVKAGAANAATSVDGDFAVAFHGEDGSAFMAVDRFASHTLCYCVKDGQLRFDTRADVLAGADPAIDPQAIFDYLYFHMIPAPRTIFKGIFRLPPGHYVEFSNGKLTVASYWNPRFKEIETPSFDALKTEFRSIVRDAVLTQLDNGKAACFLSGGTDSSTVAGMMARASGRSAASYSIGFDAQGYDEMEFARLASKHFGTEHHEYYVTPDDLVRAIPSVAASCDQPFGNSSLLPAYYCAKMAHDDGVSTLLAGDGGDELFGGNSRYAKQRIFGWYQHVPVMVREKLMEPLLSTRAAAKVPLTRKAGSYVEQARAPMPDRLQLYNLIIRLGVNDILTPAMLEQVDTTAPLQLQRAVWTNAQGGSHLNQELAFDWRFTLADSDLPKVRFATELAGVAVGFPMLDSRLLDFSLKLPTAYKLKNLTLRWFFKEALRGFLPDEILAKKKQGFGLPFGVWANNTPNLKSMARYSLNSLAERGIVRREFIETLLNQRLPEHPGYFGEMVWILMMLEQWLAAKAPSYRVA
jgi:asparagine synthase (glutamine-hydrolysing)